MTEQQAKRLAATLRAEGWDVEAQLSPIGRLGWELKGKAADGNGQVYGFTNTDIEMLVLGGQVARTAEAT